jgi:hypothetical protein
MPLVEIWVPLIGKGTTDDPWRPDVPDGIKWGSNEGAPTNFEDPAFRPAVSAFNILVDEKDAASIHQVEPPKHDVALVGMIRACRGDWDRKLAEWFETPVAAAVDSGDAASLLKQAYHRGASAAVVQAVAAAKDIEVVLPAVRRRA